MPALFLHKRRILNTFLLHGQMEPSVLMTHLALTNTMFLSKKMLLDKNVPLQLVNASRSFWFTTGVIHVGCLKRRKELSALTCVSIGATQAQENCCAFVKQLL